MATSLVVSMWIEREPEPSFFVGFEVRVLGSVAETGDEYVPTLKGLDSDSSLVKSLEDLTEEERQSAGDLLCSKHERAKKAAAKYGQGVAL